LIKEHSFGFYPKLGDQQKLATTIAYGHAPPALHPYVVISGQLDQGLGVDQLHKKATLAYCQSAAMGHGR
jgi:hypothetical protein